VTATAHLRRYGEDVQWSVEAARGLAGERLSAQRDRWAHVRGVGALAEQLITELGTGDHLALAAWLHDIGYAESGAQTGFHALDGARLLASLGAPADVVCLVAYHSGSEFEAEERGLANELAAIDRPNQSDIDALTFADMTTSPKGSPIAADERISEILDRYPPESPVHRAVVRSRGYLIECVTRTRQRLAATR
jgi:putative nucleotidyltransferase with HDIG domain